jgi:hypothetical protein
MARMGSNEGIVMANFQAVDAAISANQIESNSFTPDYEHHQRRVAPGPDLILSDSRLKWYQIHRPDVEIPNDLVEESRRFIREEIEGGRLQIANEFGFVMLHLGDEPASRNTFAMLFVCTWRNNNELWRTLYTRTLRSNQGFERYVDDGHVGGFCVWELVPVWHERQAWSRLLYSSRDEAARDVYLDDLIEGLV